MAQLGELVWSNHEVNQLIQLGERVRNNNSYRRLLFGFWYGLKVNQFLLYNHIPCYPKLT